VNIAIWTDNDLDGAGSALALKLMYNTAKNLTIQEARDSDFVGVFTAWMAKNYDLYDKIFITDLYVPDEVLDIADRPKVVIIDHHESHAEVSDRYKQAKVIIENTTSCVALILKTFNKVLVPRLTEKQIGLFNIIDDYDSYKLQYADSLKLNAVYRTYTRPKVDKFIEAFGSGIRPFTVLELNAIKLYFNRYKEQVDKAVFYEGKIKGFKVISCCAQNSINEIASYALKKYNADIAMIVMVDLKAVSFRKNKETCDIKLNKLAEIMCDGGGHEYAAAGKTTEKFLTFTKTLQPCI